MQSGVWTQIGAKIDGESHGDLSGGAVSISGDGNRVAIGAVGNDGGHENDVQRDSRFNDVYWSF